MVEVPQYNSNVRAARGDRTALRAPDASNMQNALNTVSDVSAKIAQQGFEREATAQAKDVDTAISDQIRVLMYDPQSGFMAQQGQNAVQSRAKMMEKLDKLQRTAGDGLSPAAKRKVEAAITARIARAKQSVDTHTMTERNTWLNGAADARIAAAQNDALFSGADVSGQLAIVTEEIRQKGARLGWSAEQTSLAVEEASSDTIYKVGMKLAQGDPLFAQDFFEKNKDSMTGAMYSEAITTLRPVVKAATGRGMALQEFTQLGNMSGLLEIADDVLGMDENAQNEALRAFMADGGVNLDPAVTAWCAGFINSVLGKAGIGGTGSNMARSFLHWGQEVTEPQRGDIVVLPRGTNPNEGHVGLFDGFNEDGTVRLLSGNSGNGVTISSYPASSVLGYRRAVTDPDRGDAAVSLQRLAQIEDPDVRKAAIDEFNLQMEAATAVKDARRVEAVEAVEEHLQGGGSTNELSVEQRRAIGAAGMEALRNREISIKRGIPITTDRSAYMELFTMSQEDPAKFKSVNLAAYSDRLNDADYKGFIQMQKTKATPAEMTTSSRLMSVIGTNLRSVGIDPNAGADDKEAAEKVESIKYEMLRWSQEFQSQTGRKPTDAEIIERVRAETVNVYLNPKGFNNDQDGPAFTIDFSEITPEMSFDLQIGGEEISREAQRDFAIAFEAEYGRAPTVEEMVNILAEGFSRR